MEVYRGDIFYLTGSSANVSGSMQRPNRLVIVVSNNKCNEFSSVVEVVFLTTAEKKPLPTHVQVWCVEQSTALCEQINSVRKDRLGDYIRTCTNEEMDAIDKALMISLGVDVPFTPVAKITASVDDETQNKLDDLMMKLEGVERENDELKAQNENLLNEMASKAIDKLDGNYQVHKLTAERDVFKKLYNELLEKLMKQKMFCFGNTMDDLK